MKGYIYKIRNKQNGKVYVGKTFNLNKRLCQHMSDLTQNKHHSHKLQRAFNKYGKEAFECSYEIYELDDENELSKLEIQEIQKEDSYNNGYNETLGGDGCMLTIDFNTRVLIYHIMQHYSGVSRLIARYYDCDHTTISEIGKNVLYASESYNQAEYERLIQDIQIPDGNLKENYIAHNEKKLNQQSCLEILSVITSTKGYDKTLCEVFNIDSKVTYRLKNGQIYQEYIEIFNKLTGEEKEALRQQTFMKYNLEARRAQRQRKGVKDPLTQEQVDFILDNKGKLSQVQISKELNISTSRVSSVQRRISYLDLIADYDARH